MRIPTLTHTYLYIYIFEYVEPLALKTVTKCQSLTPKMLYKSEIPENIQGHDAFGMRDSYSLSHM